MEIFCNGNRCVSVGQKYEVILDPELDLRLKAQVKSIGEEIILEATRTLHFRVNFDELTGAKESPLKFNPISQNKGPSLTTYNKVDKL